MKKLDIQVPALGESITEATIAKCLKKIGDYVEKDEAIIELETDKVSQEIYALESGKIINIFFKEGEDVKIGDTLASIDTSSKLEVKNTSKESLKNEEKTALKNSFFELTVPSLGESITEATIGKWIKNKGEKVKKGEPLVEIETDKVTQELYSEFDGILADILFEEEDDVTIGEVIAKVSISDGRDETITDREEESKNKVIFDKNEKNGKIELDPTIIKRSGVGNKISLIDLKEFSNELSFSPASKKIIREENIDTSSLTPTSGSNRVNKSDLVNSKFERLTYEENHVTKLEKNSKTDLEKPLSKLRQSIASRLKAAQNTAAMLTTFNEIDMFKLIDIRKKYKDKFFDKYGVKLGFMSFFTKAAITVLKEIPEINAEIRENSIIYKNRYDIGIAVGTERGLFVPVIKQADKMSFSEIEKAIVGYGNLAKENKLSLEDMKDGTFTISNGGVYGSMLSTPILNTPQSGILGLHNIVNRPWVVNNEIIIRPIMYVALTYDHRIVDGKGAVTFLVRIKEIIENPERMMFEL